MTATPDAATTGSPIHDSTSRIGAARDRVHAMESLAAIVAHELRAGVLGVTSAAQLLRYSLPADPVAEKSLGRILQESERLSALHEALTEYATELPPRRVAGNPDRMWENAARAMRGLLEAKSVTIELRLGAPTAAALIDAEQLERAFERVLRHCVDLVRPDEELTVESRIADRSWISVVSTSRATPSARKDRGRPGLDIVLAQRTAVAHGGEILDHGETAGLRLATISLPLSEANE